MIEENIIYEFVKSLQLSPNKYRSLQKNIDETVSTNGSVLTDLQESVVRMQLGRTFSERLELLVDGLVANGFDYQRLRELYDETLRSENSAIRINGQSSGLRYKFVYWGDPDYPRKLATIVDPPLCFAYMGHSAPWLQRKGLAIVGSRDPDCKSLRWMQTELNAFLAQGRGDQVFSVSGGAIGIDQAAHLLSIGLELPTLVILPAGLGQVYPANLVRLFDSIFAAGGAIMSEYPLQAKMRKYYFAERNRLISGVAEATLVVEAKKKSGTLITAHAALIQGRPLYVVPGHPESRSYAGNIELLKLGGAMVSCAEDLTLSWQLDTPQLQRNCSYI